MIPKITVVFNRRKTATDTKTGSIDFSISHNGKRRLLSTGIAVTLKEWRNGMVVGKNAVALNKQIRAVYDKLTTDIAKMVEDGAVDLQSLSICAKSGDVRLSDYVDKYASERNISEGTKRNMVATVKVLAKRGFTSASQLTRDGVRRLIGKLSTELSDATIKQYLICVNSLAKLMERDGVIEFAPKIEFHPKKKESSIKFLTEEQVRQIAELELRGFRAKARDIFLFSVYTGLSRVDIFKITKESVITENGRYYIISSRQKTKVPYKVTLSAKAMEILQRYDYRLVAEKNWVHKNVRKIGEQIGLPFPLSMHKGRHTFATIALNHGVPMEVVSKMLAHADIKTTQIYAKVLQRSVDEGYDKLEHIF